ELMCSAPDEGASRRAPDEISPSPIFVLLGRRRRAAPAHRQRTNLSCPAGACDRAIRARRSDRRIRPADGAEALRAIGGAVLCREHRRRRRKYWGGSRAQSTADGYTILVNGANHVVNPSLYQRVPYDPVADFDPVTIAVSAPAVLTVNPALPVQTVGELGALIKANPGKYSFASPGTGTPPHLVGELFRLSLGLD